MFYLTDFSSWNHSLTFCKVAGVMTKMLVAHHQISINLPDATSTAAGGPMKTSFVSWCSSLH